MNTGKLTAAEARFAGAGPETCLAVAEQRDAAWADNHGLLGDAAVSAERIAALAEQVAEGTHNMSHTPGPWEVAESSFYHKGHITDKAYFVRRPGDDVSIADEIQDPDTAEPSKANADLIAAAPQLKAALLNLMAAYGKAAGIGQPNLNPAWLDAKAAIDAAEGRQP